MPEGLSHVVNGGLDCAFSQGSEICSRESGFAESLGKCGEYDCTLPWFGDRDEVGIVFELETVEELAPPAPAAIKLILG